MDSLTPVPKTDGFVLRVLSVVGALPVLIACMAVLFAASAVGTFLPLGQATAQIYHSPWFFAVLGILCLNTLACVVRELLRRKVALSFLMLHFGTLIILVGAGWGHLAGIEGRVGIAVGEGTVQFYTKWKGTDRLQLRGGRTLPGQFRGIEKGKVFLAGKDGKMAVFPLEAVRRLEVDPDRPGRKIEKDRLHLKSRKIVEGFVTALGEGEVKIRTDSGIQRIPRPMVFFLKMGEPSAHPLGFRLKLKNFRIETYPGTGKKEIVLKTPWGKTFPLAPETGRVVDMGRGYHARVLRYFPDAVVDRQGILKARSEDVFNEAVEVEILWPDGIEKQVAFAGRGRHHQREVLSRVEMVFQRSPGMPKAYVSTVEVYEEDRLVEYATIKVNHPFSYGGFTFFQSSYDMSSPKTRSIFQVVRDPGLPMAYAGFVLMILGSLGLGYVRPFRAYLRRRKAGQPPPPSEPDGEKDEARAEGEDA